jgi:hypothetical protein
MESTITIVIVVFPNLQTADNFRITANQGLVFPPALIGSIIPNSQSVKQIKTLFDQGI